MLATVTVKGQVTVPKSLRDQLNIEPGTQLDLKLNDDGTMLVKPLKRSVLSIVGLLHRPGRKAATIEQMSQAAVDIAAERQQRSRK